ncbi:MAG: hypothetical protein ACOX5J_07365 [Candidatus Hydrogenedentales bacterium]|jgi:hypothetical protein
MAAITIDTDISARVTQSRVSEMDTRQVLLRWIFAEMDLACRIQRSIEVAAQAQAVVLAEIARIIRTGQVIHNHLNRNADQWLVIHGRLGVNADAAVRVTHPWLRSIDTSVRTSGARINRSDTVQRIAIPAGLLADTRQILFAVLIDQDHKIQT